MEVEIKGGIGIPKVFKSAAVVIREDSRGEWKFEITRYLDKVDPSQRLVTSGSLVVKEAMFAKEASGSFESPGAVPVPETVRLEFARALERALPLLYA